MNNLKEIMQKKGVTALELAKSSGLAVTNIRRIMNDPEATPYHPTAEKLAKALGVSIAQIYAQKAPVAGDAKLLGQRVEDAARAILDALRDYADTPAHFHLSIFANEVDWLDMTDYWASFDGETIIKNTTWHEDKAKGPK
jgi:transcriptional regulator with XRE-family HTH domain